MLLGPYIELMSRAVIMLGPWAVFSCELLMTISLHRRKQREEALILFPISVISPRVHQFTAPCVWKQKDYRTTRDCAEGMQAHKLARRMAPCGDARSAGEDKRGGRTSRAIGIASSLDLLAFHRAPLYLLPSLLIRKKTSWPRIQKAFSFCDEVLAPGQA